MGFTGEGEGEETREDSRVHRVPGILPKASEYFKGGQETSSWRPCYRNDITLVDEHLGISLNWEDQQTTAGGDQIWATACCCTAQAKNGFYNSDFFFNFFIGI